MVNGRTLETHANGSLTKAGSSGRHSPTCVPGVKEKVANCPSPARSASIAAAAAAPMAIPSVFAWLSVIAASDVAYRQVQAVLDWLRQGGRGQSDQDVMGCGGRRRRLRRRVGRGRQTGEVRLVSAIDGVHRVVDGALRHGQADRGDGRRVGGTRRRGVAALLSALTALRFQVRTMSAGSAAAAEAGIARVAAVRASALSPTSQRRSSSWAWIAS